MWIALVLAFTQAATVAQQPADPAAVAKGAKRAQERFERVRSSALPIIDRDYTRRCDVTVGSYCYWYEQGHAFVRPSEPGRVTAARRELLATLDSLAAQSPSDSLIFALRVMYRIDGGDTTAAVRTAESECHSAEWWCRAIQGYAHHVAGDFTRAQEAFDAAIAAMPPDRRCAWEDVSLLLPRSARGRFHKLPCEVRRRVAERLWWLSDPLHSDAANDFRSEFLARRMAAALGGRGIAPRDLLWNRDAEEMLLRYGWPIWWSRERQAPSATMASARASVVGHERSPSFAFVPRAAIIADSAAVPQMEDWLPTEPIPDSRYAPIYAGAWREIGAQLARFRRGDSLLLVAAYAADDGTLQSGVARLVVSPGPGRAPWMSRPRTSLAGTLALALPAVFPDRLALATIEVIDTESSGIARHRAGVVPIDDRAIAVSDVLLHAPAPDGAARGEATLDDVLGRALPSSTITSSKVGIYWEAYCRSREGPIDVLLSLERTNRSWVDRMASRLHLTSPPGAIRIQWTDTPAPGPRCAARSITLDTSDLDDGTYDLRLAVRTAQGDSATAFRRVRLKR